MDAAREETPPAARVKIAQSAVRKQRHGLPFRKPRPPAPPTARNTSANWLDAFTTYAAGECHLADNTVAAYRRDIRRFFQWLAGRSIPGLSIRDLADYAVWLYGKGLAPASIARHVVSLKVFFRYLQLEGALEQNLAELLGSQKLWQRVPKVLSPQQIDRLFQCPHEGDPCWRRDRAMLELLYATGCRASELSGLRMCDMHLDEGYCICRGKGDKQRLVPIGGRAVAAVREYLQHERGALAGAPLARGRVGPAFLSGPSFAAGADLGTSEALCPALGRRRRSVRTRCGTVSPPTCSAAGPIFARCKRCWATRALPRRRFTRTWTPRG